MLNRFHNDLASNYLYSLIKKDLKTEAAEEDYLTKSIHELFEKFIPNKKYIGPQLDQDGNLRFAVKTRDGYEHDINELSSGEKEILMGYVQIYGKSPKNSILMLDEPELHLNPRLIKGLPDFYKNHLGENFNNQIWLVTHSDTILSESAKNTSYTVFHITAADNSTIQQAHKISSKDEADKALLELIGDLSQYKPDRKIVIVEGENSEFDKKMITKLFPDFSNSVNLISAGSKSKVSSLHNLMQHVFKESGYNNKVYGIVDSDFDGKKEHKIYTWDSYHIENYLIIPEILSEITTSRLNESMHLSIEQALHELIKIAKDKVKYLAQQATQKYINDEIVKQIKINCDKKPETIANDLKTTLLSSKNRIVTIADRMGMDNTIENVFNKNCTDLNKSFDEDSWLKKFPGREILKEFRKLHVSWMDYEGFRDQIIERMINKNIEPSGMKEVLEKIANTNP